jgi:hypothetical protein
MACSRIIHNNVNTLRNHNLDLVRHPEMPHGDKVPILVHNILILHLPTDTRICLIQLYTSLIMDPGFPHINIVFKHICKDLRKELPRQDHNIQITVLRNSSILISNRFNRFNSYMWTSSEELQCLPLSLNKKDHNPDLIPLRLNYNSSKFRNSSLNTNKSNNNQRLSSCSNP